MKYRHSLFKTPSFIALATAATGAVILHRMHESWGGERWFPLAVGLVAATAIIALRNMLERGLYMGGKWPNAVFLFFVAAFFSAGIPFIWNGSPWLSLGTTFFCAFMIFAGLATICEWPGFRPAISDEEDEIDNETQDTEDEHQRNEDEQIPLNQ